jgi:hypothetical protein
MSPLQGVAIYVFGVFVGALLMGVVWTYWLLGRIEDRLKDAAKDLEG